MSAAAIPSLQQVQMTFLDSAAAFLEQARVAAGHKYLPLPEELLDWVPVEIINVFVLVAAMGITISLLRRALAPPDVLLLDFALFRPDDSLKIPFGQNRAMFERVGCYTPELLDFQDRVLRRSGLGEETYFPPGVHENCTSMDAARKEAETVMYGVVDSLLKRTGVEAKDIDILVVNCSLFTPTPSLASMIIHHFNMRSDIRSFNLGGMGCSAGVIAVDLAADLLRTHPSKNALVVSTENITLNWYKGKEKSMLLPNCLFRMGAAAVLLTNKRKHRRTARYRLEHTVRIHTGQSAESYGAVYEEEDSTGVRGVRLSRKITSVAGRAMERNLRVLGPRVLPLAEQLRFGAAFVARRYLGLKKQVAAYTPSFTKAFDVVCVHAGGRAVLDTVQKALSLTDHQVEPSRATLQRWGNTSSSSIWYELGYSEYTQRVRKGDRVWQLGFGSGFMCNSATWIALRDAPCGRHADEWGGYSYEPSPEVVAASAGVKSKAAKATPAAAGKPAAAPAAKATPAASS